MADKHQFSKSRQVEENGDDGASVPQTLWQPINTRQNHHSYDETATDGEMINRDWVTC